MHKSIEMSLRLAVLYATEIAGIVGPDQRFPDFAVYATSELSTAKRCARVAWHPS